MPDLPPGINTGFQIRPPRVGAWVMDGETGAAKEILVANGRWGVYLPDEETQAVWLPYVLDTSACVTFSATNGIESPLIRMRSLGLLPATHEAFLLNAGYINKQTGKPNFSDRFTAKMSGTTKKGNHLEAVGDSIRNHGLLPESDYRFPDFSDLPGDGNYDARFARYYEEIDNSLKVKAKRFLDYFDINYQWVMLGTTDPAKLREALKYGPVQVAAEICSPWSSNDGMPPIPKCGCSPGHATLIYGEREDGSWEDFDHYKSFRKLLASDYCLPWGFQYYIKPKSLVTPGPFHYVFNIDLRSGMDATPEVRNLQRALQTVKRLDGSTYMKAGVFGKYGPTTTAAVKQFQEDNGIVGNGGINFGPQTRKAMNAKLNM